MKKLVLLCAAVFTLGLVLPIQAQAEDYVLVVPVKVMDNANELDSKFAYSVRRGNFQDAAFLVETRGIDANMIVENNTKKRALHYVAGKKGGLDFAKTLIEKGADVNAKTSNNLTPLYYAVAENDKDLFVLLKSKGAKEDSSKNLLDYAKTTEMAEYIVSKGANVNSADENKMTPLHKAAMYDNKEMVEFLLKKGANVNPQNKIGYTPLDSAKNDEIKQILIKHVIMVI